MMVLLRIAKVSPPQGKRKLSVRPQDGSNTGGSTPPDFGSHH